MQIGTNLYSGHAGTGGLQQHSLGSSFPWVAIAQGDLNPPEYRAFNCVTGQCGPLRSVCAQAGQDAADYAAATHIARAIHRGSLRIWGDQ